jgi:LEA14-like dessication related protein
LKDNKKSRKRLIGALLTLALIVVIALAAVYIHLSNVLSTTLLESLGTTDIDSVTYAYITPGSVDLNVTWKVTNPTDLPLTVERIVVYFFVDDRDIGGVEVPLNQELPPDGIHHFSMIQSVRDAQVLESLNSPTYILKVRQGIIGGSARYLFVQTRISKKLAFSRTIEGIPQAKS